MFEVHSNIRFDPTRVTRKEYNPVSQKYRLLYIVCDGYHGCFFREDGCFDVKEDGQCNWIYINEAVYVEERKAGRKIGQRTYTRSDGRQYVGEWKDGNPWLGIEYDKDGNVTAIYVEGIRTE